jgi:hypothetical protein
VPGSRKCDKSQLSSHGAWKPAKELLHHDKLHYSVKYEKLRNAEKEVTGLDLFNLLDLLDLEMNLVSKIYFITREK